MNDPNLGADLSSYQKELDIRRCARTLSLRRVTRPTISGSLDISRNTFHRGQIHNIRSPQLAQLSVDNTIQIFSSRNQDQIVSQCMQIQQVNIPRVLLNLSTSLDLVNCIINSLSEDYSEQTKIYILIAICSLFPHTESYQDTYVDGIVCCLLEYMDSQSPPLILQTLETMSVMVEHSSYARDSFISFGFVDYLIQIAQGASVVELCRSACKAIFSIFSNTEPIDIQIMQDNVANLKDLLNLQDLEALKFVINTFAELANKNPSIVYVFYDNGIYAQSMQLIRNPQLIPETIFLIGNLSLGKRPHIQYLLENGLFQILMELYENVSIRPEILWTISNLIESSAPLVLPLITPQLVQDVLENYFEGSFDLKKESAYLISTLIIYLSSDNIQIFLISQVAESLVEMCTCGQNLIVTRCTEALIRLLTLIQSGIPGDDFLNSLVNTNISEIVNEIIDSNLNIAKDKISLLQSMIESFQTNN